MQYLTTRSLNLWLAWNELQEQQYVKKIKSQIKKLSIWNKKNVRNSQWNHLPACCIFVVEHWVYSTFTRHAWKRLRCNWTKRQTWCDQILRPKASRQTLDSCTSEWSRDLQLSFIREHRAHAINMMERKVKVWTTLHYYSHINSSPRHVNTFCTSHTPK